MKIIRRFTDLFVSKSPQCFLLPTDALIDTFACLPRVSLEACELSCRHFHRLVGSTDGLALRRIPLLKVVRVKRRLGIVTRLEYIVKGHLFKRVILCGTHRARVLGLLRALANTTVDTLYFRISVNDTDAEVWHEEINADEKAFRNMNIGSIDFFVWERNVRVWLDVCDRLKALGHRLDCIGWKMKVANTNYRDRHHRCLGRLRRQYCDPATLLAPMVFGREHQLTDQLKLRFTDFTLETLRWFIQEFLKLSATVVMPRVVVNFNASLAHNHGAFGGPVPDELLSSFWSCGGEPALSPFHPIHLTWFWIYPRLVNEYTHHQLEIWIMHDGAAPRAMWDDYPDFPIEPPTDGTTLLVLANEMSWYYGLDPRRFDGW